MRYEYTIRFEIENVDPTQLQSWQLGKWSEPVLNVDNGKIENPTPDEAMRISQSGVHGAFTHMWSDLTRWLTAWVAQNWEGAYLDTSEPGEPRVISE